MNPLFSIFYVLFVGFLIAAIPMYFQAKALKLEATIDNKKLALSKEITQVASLLIGLGAGGLVILTIVMVVTPLLNLCK